MTLVYWSQPSSVVMCIQNSYFSIGITSLYGFQPIFVAFVCKTATLGPQLQVSMSPRPRLWFFAFKTATLGPELRVCIGPRPHLWFFYIQNSAFSTSLYGYQPSSVVLYTHNSDIMTRINSLYEAQTFTCRFVYAKQRD